MDTPRVAMREALCCTPVLEVRARARRQVCAAALAFVLGLGAPARAQEPAPLQPPATTSLTTPPPPNLEASPAPDGVVITPDVQRYARYLKRNLVVINLSLFSGLTLKQGGVELSPGLFGSRLFDTFKDSLRATELTRSYRTQAIAGAALTAVGAVAAITGLVGLAGLAGARSTERGPLVMWSVVSLSGTVALAVGAVLLGSSQSRLLEAINAWNEDLVDGALPEAESARQPKPLF